MIDIIVCSLIYYICGLIQKAFKCGDYREEPDKPKYRMKEVPDEEVIFFTNSSDPDEAFKL